MEPAARRHAVVATEGCQRQRGSRQEAGMTIAAERPEARGGLTRRAVLGGGLVLTLAGCNSGGVDMPGDFGKPGAAVPPAAGPLVGETLGTGPVRVGMILPLTQNGGPSPIGVSMRNAAQLAIDGFGAPYITLMIEDDHSSPDAAAQAAQAELGAGAQLVLGPVFANDVRSASAAAKSAGKPMIAFSTDVSVAAPGVYLLSFLIQGYVDRILQYAVSSGKKSFGILAPQNDYGNVAADRFQDRAQGLNVQMVVTARYSAGQMAGAAQQVAAVARPDRRALHSRAGRRHARRCERARVSQRQDPVPGNRRVERRARAQIAADAGRLVLRARQFRLRRLRPALPGQIQQRPGASGDARL